MSRKHTSLGLAKRVRTRECDRTITLLVADESRMGCQLMASAFKESPYHIRVTSLAVESTEVLRGVQEGQPDIVVMRAGLKDGPAMGLKTARKLRVSGSKTKTIILIDANVCASVIEAFRAGASGIFCREEPFETLCECIDAVQRGQIWISTDQLRYVVDYLVETSPASAPSSRGSNLLTKREESVVEQSTRGN